MITLPLRFRQAAGVPSRTVPEQVILARPDRDDFDSLTGPAIAVWHLLEHPRTMDELVDTLTWAYRAPRDEVERDVHKLLRDLLDLGAVEGDVDVE